MKFYYNCWHPLEILQSLVIKVSTINGRNRGVSVASQMINSHGPFTFVFDNLTDLQQVEYGAGSVDFTHKPEIFANEFEWWSQEPVHFQLDDVEAIIFRMNSPGARIHPRIAKRTAKTLQQKYREIYDEIRANL